MASELIVSRCQKNLIRSQRTFRYTALCVQLAWANAIMTALLRSRLLESPYVLNSFVVETGSSLPGNTKKTRADHGLQGYQWG